MTALGAALALLVGFVLGLLGGGGAILTVPILVYVLHVPVKLAIATSLAVVGLASLIGFLAHLRQRTVATKAALIFAPAAVVGAYSGATLAQYLTGEFQLVLFGTVALTASVLMLRGGRRSAPATSMEGYRFDPTRRAVTLLVLQAAGVGVLTGIIGVGGGFLIVPALVVFAKLPMRLAIGTSLLVITLNALSGFAGYLGHVVIDWPLVGWFAGLAAVGTVAGTSAGQRVPQRRLQQVFGILLLGVSLYVLYRR